MGRDEKILRFCEFYGATIICLSATIKFYVGFNVIDLYFLYGVCGLFLVYSVVQLTLWWRGCRESGALFQSICIVITGPFAATLVGLWSVVLFPDISLATRGVLGWLVVVVYVAAVYGLAHLHVIEHKRQR